MRDLLKGTKKAFKRSTIKSVYVTDRRYITMKRIVAQVKNNPFYMKYLPDKPHTAGRQFVYNVVNSLDPDYFRVALGEVERLKIVDMNK